MLSSTSLIPQAADSSRNINPRSTKKPLIPATTAPRAIRLTFCSTSALASSISSRTSSDTFSETRDTSSPKDLSSAVMRSRGELPSKAPHQSRQQQASEEGGAEQELGTLGERAFRRHRVAV